MSRCHSWRPVEGSGHPVGHAPGHCRKCWRPCFRRTGPGRVRCDECEDALANHPDEMVRRCLAADDDASDDVLELLATDLNPSVQRAASYRLQVAEAERTRKREGISW